MDRLDRTYVLSNFFYPPECVARTIDEFRLVCDVNQKLDEHAVTITLRPLNDAPEETPEEFMNFLLCASMEKLLA